MEERINESLIAVMVKQIYIFGIVGIGALVMTVTLLSRSKDVASTAASEKFYTAVSPKKDQHSPASNFEKARRVYSQQASHRAAALTNYTERGFGLLYNVLVPEVFCENLVRIGRIGDGGKWVCNPFNLPKNKKCAIFSLGIANDVSFDVQFQEATNKTCRLYAFDKGRQNPKVLDSLSKVNAEFKVALLGGTTDEKRNAYTMKYLMDLYGLDTVEILKIDIEGAEFKVIPPVISSSRICQILIEIHGNVTQVIGLLKEFASHGYYLFSYEINGYYHQLSEYSFIHESCLETYNAQILARYLL